MAHRSFLPEAVDRYLGTVVARESPVMQRLRAETARLPQGGMQIGADQGVLLAFLIRLDRRAPRDRDRHLHRLQRAGGGERAARRRSPRLLRRERGVDRDRAPLLGRGRRRREDRPPPAARAGNAGGAACAKAAPGRFDFAFIDADKTGYDGYYEACLALLRAGGLIAIDNVLWSGTVADPADNAPDTVALRAITTKIRDDARVDACLVSIGDGVMLARKL